MLKIIDKIKSNQGNEIKLFFEKDKIGKEVISNLVTVSLEQVIIKKNEINLLIESLLKTIEKIENSLKLLYSEKPMIFYCWHDEGEDVLRWTVISDLNQEKLPFSSNIKEVPLNKIVENWVNSSKKLEELPLFDFKNMSLDELQFLRNSRKLQTPNIDVFKLNIGKK